MWRSFDAGLIDACVVRQGLESIDQGLAQSFQTAELSLLIRKGLIQLGQELFLVGHLSLDIDQAVFVHKQHLRMQLPTLRPSHGLFNPARSFLISACMLGKHVTRSI